MEDKYDNDDDADDDNDNLVGDLILMIHPKLNIVQAVLHLHLATNKVIFYKILYFCTIPVVRRTFVECKFRLVTNVFITLLSCHIIPFVIVMQFKIYKH